MGPMRILAVLAVAVSVFASCTSQAPLPPGAIRIPTDETLTNAATSGTLCVGSTVPPFVGTLEGDPSDAVWPVWLRAEDGHRMYMTWPRGFSVRFDPDATLLDETGTPVLYAGSPFTFQGVAHDPSKGTRDEPYLADGAWETGLASLDHCYHRPAELVRDVRPLIVTIGIALALAFALSLVLTGGPSGDIDGSMRHA
jgi:hypothetical protein